MGDRDTREASVRLATEAAKRDALEQVATYLESVTVVEDMTITRDEIRTYTAGLVVVLDQQTSLALDGDTVVVSVGLTAQIDTEEVALALMALREHADARHQLDALRLENDGLHRDLVEINQMLAQSSSIDQAQQISRQRQDILNRAQSNALVSQAWTDWVLIGPAAYPAGWGGGTGGSHTLALLNAARVLSPESPHVQRAQGMITVVQPAGVPAPPIVSRQIAATSAQSPPVPRMLNEITRAAPTVGSLAAGSPESIQGHRGFPLPTSRTFTGIRPLNPLVPGPEDRSAGVAPRGTPSASRSVHVLQQFLQPPPTIFGFPSLSKPSAERFPPVLNRTAPRTQQIPRIESRPVAGGGRGTGRAAPAARSGGNGR
ncbi:MAG: hypothetical protein NTNFB02_12360 [Nitrospira sp.]